MRAPDVTFDLAFVEAISRARAAKKAEPPRSYFAPPVITYASEVPASDAPPVVETLFLPPEPKTKRTRSAKPESA